MPQFVPQHTPSGVSGFLAGYLDAAEWTLPETITGDDGETEIELDVESLHGWSREAIHAATEVCSDFESSNAAELESYYELSGRDAESAGTDFWLSRNGHGAGFFDRGDEPVFRKLQDAARVYSGVDAYPGDDGYLHFSDQHQFPMPDDSAPQGMSPRAAWGYAASWGSAMTGGDPGACMYGFDERFHVQSEQHRSDCLAWLDGCVEDVKRDPAGFERNELDQLAALRAAIVAAPIDE